jgi:adenosylmethionine-8-amino-7-oxononanoate aminotransferase
MGAVILGPALTDRLQAASEAAEEFPHGFTASGHPVGCAVALKAIDVIMNEGLAENVKALAPQFMAGLKRLAEHPNVGEARGVGLMGALEMVRDKATKESFGGDVGVGERIANAAADNGLICRPLGPSIVLCPPFIMTPALIDDMFDRLERAMKSVFAEVA